MMLFSVPPEPTVTLTQDEEKLTLTFSVSSPAPTKYETCWKLSSATTPCTSIDPSTSPQDLTSLASCTKYDYTVYTVENNLKSDSTTATDVYTCEFTPFSLLFIFSPLLGILGAFDRPLLIRALLSSGALCLVTIENLP